MLNRFIYSIRMLFEKRAYLKRFLSRQPGCLETIEALSPEYLKEFNIKLLALDFDGVLSHHGSIQPVEPVTKWLKLIDREFSLKNVCLYSNNLFVERVQFMETHFPEITILRLSRKKPYSNDLLQFAQEKQVAPENILVVDDRVTSGVLSACIIGANALLVRKPLIRYGESTFKECFYVIIRKIEKIMLLIYSALR